MATIFALAFGYFSIVYYACKAIKLLKENWGVISAPLSFVFANKSRSIMKGGWPIWTAFIMSKSYLVNL